MSTASQYYSPFSPDDWDASKIAAWLLEKVGADGSVSYIDIDYDAISQAVVFTAVWSEAPSSKGWRETITSPGEDSTIEIGVLAHEPNTDPEDIQFGGFLTVLGRDDKPSTRSPTHHNSPSLTQPQSQRVSKHRHVTTPS